MPTLADVILVFNNTNFNVPQEGFVIPYFVRCPDADLSKWKQAIMSVWVRNYFDQQVDDDALSLASNAVKFSTRIFSLLDSLFRTQSKPPMWAPLNVTWRTRWASILFAL